MGASRLVGGASLQKCPKCATRKFLARLEARWRMVAHFLTSLLLQLLEGSRVYSKLVKNAPPCATAPPAGASTVGSRDHRLPKTSRAVFVFLTIRRSVADPDPQCQRQRPGPSLKHMSVFLNGEISFQTCAHRPDMSIYTCGQHCSNSEKVKAGLALRNRLTSEEA